MAPTDRDALLALYNATGGSNWKNSTNWDTDADLSDWYGVEVNAQGRAVKLSTGKNNLRGILGLPYGHHVLLSYDVLDHFQEIADRK